MAVDIAGNYKILEKLGEGGMGEVFKGLDVSLERNVAIKALRPELTQHPEILERFRKEAVALARLNHPNIATLYSFVSHGEGYYMVMEFAPGKTLGRIIAEHREGLPWRRALSLFGQALQAIEHAHHQGIIHRDIKPPNMMLSDRGILKVLDFGIARVLDATRFTRTGLVVGTPKYMAPEQIQGRQVDARSDIYALGIVLYEMVTGQVPFLAPSEYDLMRAQLEQPPTPLRKLVPLLPKAIEEAVVRALAKTPEERFQTVNEFMDALQEPLESNERLPSALSPSTLMERRIAAEGDHVGKQGSTASLLAFPRASELRQIKGAVASTASMIGATALDMHSEDKPSVVSLERAIARREDARQKHTDPGSSGSAGSSGEGARQAALAKNHALARFGGAIRSGAFVFWGALIKRRGVAIALGVVTIAASSVLIYATIFSSSPLEQAPERVPALVKQGKSALADGKLTEPLEDNALAYAEQALSLSLEDGEARQLMEEVIALMVELGEVALAEGSIAQAKDYRDRVESLTTKYGVSAESAAALSKRVAAEEGRHADMLRERIVRAQRERRVERLLEKARQGLAAGRLTEPRKDNAMSHAREVLKLAPGHAEAREILGKVLQGSVARGETALGEGDLAQAEALRDTARSLVVQYGLADNELALLDRRIVEEEQGLAEREARVGALVGKAERAREAGRWTAPAGDNVLGFARQILDLAPAHTGARQLIAQTVAKSLEAAASALNRGEIEKARVHSEQARELVQRYEIVSTELNWLTERIAAEEHHRQEVEQREARRKARTEDLLERAREAFAAGRLSHPERDNALAYAREVLILAPGNTDARGLISEILQSTVAQSEQALGQGDLDQAKTLRETARSLVEEYELADSDLVRLDRGIADEEQKLATQAAREARISELMDKANKARVAGRWAEPGAGSVLAYASQVLGLLPEHQGARELVAQTVAWTIELAEAAFDRGELDKAKSLNEQAQEIARQYAVAGTDPEGLAQRIAAEERRRQQLGQRQAETAARLEELTRRANKALAANNLTAPKRDNVVAYARELFALSPQDAQAQRLLGAVIERYVEMADKALAEGEIRAAQGAQQRARDVAAEFGIANNDLVRLGERIAAKEWELAEAERKHEEARRLAEAKAAEEEKRGLAETKAAEEGKRRLAEAKAAEEEARRIAEAKAAEEEKRRLAEAKAAEEESRKAARVDDIDGLLAKATKALAANRLTTPAGDNAVAYAAKILKLEPQQPEAQRIVSEAAAWYVSSAERALAQGDLNKAQRYQQAAQKLITEYPLTHLEVQALAERISNELKQQAETARRKKDEEPQRLTRQHEAKKAAQAEQIDSLLRKAQQALAANRSTLPAGDNAVDYAGQVLSLQPKHAQARRILEEIIGRLVALGEVALAKGKLEEAQKQQRAAQRVIARYRLPEVELRSFSGRIARAERRFAEEQAEKAHAATLNATPERDSLPQEGPEVSAPEASRPEQPQSKRPRMFGTF